MDPSEYYDYCPATSEIEVTMSAMERLLYYMSTIGTKTHHHDMLVHYTNRIEYQARFR